MWGQTLVFLVFTGGAACLLGLLACVMTLASIAVGDPDPMAWAKGLISRSESADDTWINERWSAHIRAEQEYERQRDAYQRSLSDRLTGQEKMIMKCQRCKRRITLFRGYWWSEDDDFMCPDGEEQHYPERVQP